MSDDFSTYIQGERDRLDTQRSHWIDIKRQCDGKLAEIANEYAAIDAYERAKTGKPVPAATRRSYARRGNRREDILSALRQAPAGASRGELLDHLGVKGEKSDAVSVSNALYKLVRDGEVAREGGRYYLVDGHLAARLAAAAE